MKTSIFSWPIAILPRHLVVAIVVLLFAAIPPLAGQEPATRSFDAEGILAVELDVARGDLVLEGTVESRLVLTASEDTVAEQDGTTLRIRRASGAETPIRLRLPTDIDVTARVERGDVTLRALYGTFSITVQIGRVQLDGLTGRFDVALKRGQIEAHVLLNEASTFQTEKGDIALEILDTGAAPLSVTTGEGDLTVRLPSAYPASLDARAIDGEIRSRLPVDLELAPESEGGKHLVGTLTGGGPPLRLETGHGDIALSPIEEEAATPTLVAPYASQGILIDARFEAGWLDAPVYPVGKDAIVQVAWDSRRLYLALVAYESDWDTFRLATTDRDDPAIEGDDTFDFVFDVGSSRYRITVNAIGTVFDLEAKADTERIEWDGRVSVATTFYPTAWVLELAVPYAELGWNLAEGDRFGFNVFRVRGGGRGWDSWAADKGEVLFAPPVEDGRRLVLEIEQRPSETVERGPEPWGQREIPLPTIRRALGIPADGHIRVESLPLIEERARLLSWWEEVSAAAEMDPVGPDGSPRAVLELRNPTAARLVSIAFPGAAAIPPETLRRRFGWNPGWYSRAAIEHLQRVIERGYRQAGFVYARVGDGAQPVPTKEGYRYVCPVSEGFIVGLVVEGNERIPTEAIEEILRFDIGKPYRKQDAEAALDRLREELSRRYGAFRDVQEVGVRRVGDAWRWVLRIDETPPVRFEVRPRLDYNRVERWKVGLASHLYRGEESMTHLFFEIAHAQDRMIADEPAPRLQYRFAFFTYLEASRRVGLGASWSRQSETQWGERWPTLSALVAQMVSPTRLNWRATEGGDLLLRAAFHRRVTVAGHVGIRRERSLVRLVRTGLRPRDGVGPNRAISDGETAYGRLVFVLDGRGGDSIATNDPFVLRARPRFDMRRGVWLRLALESANFNAIDRVRAGKRKGDWNYLLAELDVRAFVPIGRRQTVRVRFLGQWTSAPLPRQRQIRFGGLYDLRSRAEPTLIGDDGRFWTVEYRVAPHETGPFFGGFFDSATVWYHNAAGTTRDSEQAAGVFVGVHIDPSALSRRVRVAELVRLDVGVPLASKGPRLERKGLHVFLRTELPF